MDNYYVVTANIIHKLMSIHVLKVNGGTSSPYVTPASCYAWKQKRVYPSQGCILLEAEYVTSEMKRPRASNTIQVSYMDSRNPITWAMTTASQGLHQLEARVWSWRWASNLGTQVWDTGVLTSRPNACSEALCLIGFLEAEAAWCNGKNSLGI